MERSATVTYGRDDDPAGEQIIAKGAFVRDEGLASNPIPKFLLRLPFTIPEVGEFILESAVVAVNGNASLAVRRVSEPAESLFLAAWVWQNEVNPFFGVRLPATGVIKVYLQTSASPGATASN